MKRLIMKSIPILILLLSAGAYAVMQLFAAKPVTRLSKKTLMTAEFIKTHTRTVTVTVHSRGTVEPCLRTSLTAEVYGRIVRMADGFQTGGYFNKGDLLIEIDSQDYQTAVVQAESILAQTELKLAREQALKFQAERDWKALGPQEPNALALHKPQLAEAVAELQAALAALEKARRELSNTRITAPYDLMVERKQTDLYQYVSPGTPLADVFSVEAAEVRLPVTDADLAHLDVTIGTSRRPGALPSAELTTVTAGPPRVWHGKIVRTDGIFDPKTRITHVVVSVDDPYGFHQEASHLPLAMGLFVEARIQGKEISDRIVLPPKALCDNHSVWVICDDDTLERRSITLLYADAQRAVIEEGLGLGERVCLNSFEYAVDGMPVRPVPAQNIISADREARK